MPASWKLAQEGDHTWFELEDETGFLDLEALAGERMPFIFLDAVNFTLKRIGIVAGDSGELSTTTGTNNYTASTIFTQRSDIQHSIDLVIEMWNEAALEVFQAFPHPNVVATATVVLVANQREYTLPSDFERIAGLNREQRAMRCATEQKWLFEYPGGYLQMLADQGVATMWVGEPTYYAISPRNEALRIDYDPDANTASMTFNIAYERRVDLTSTMGTATMPFSDSVVRSLVPVIAEFYGRSKEKDFDNQIFRSSIVRAYAYANKMPQRRVWGTKQAW